MLSVPLRLIIFYAAAFLLLGIHLPFWPLWLHEQGLDARQVSLILGLGLLVRVIAAPLAGSFADDMGERRRPMIMLSMFAFASFFAFQFTWDFWSILVVSVFCMATYPPLMPMIETLAVQNAAVHGFRYGRLRIWASVAFIVANLAGGAAISAFAPDVILHLILIFALMMIAAAFVLPSDPRAPEGAAPPRRFEARALRAVVTSPLFWLFAVSGGMIQGAHALYYTIGTIHFRDIGINGNIIGLLWAIGVVSEIVVFFYVDRLEKFLSPVNMLMLGGLGAIVRWTVMAFEPSTWVVFFCQMLHGLSFGAVHVGAIFLINRSVAANCSMTAQSFYSAFSTGGIISVVTFSSGYLYTEFQATAYFAMTALAACGFIGLVVLRALWHGEGDLVSLAPQGDGEPVPARLEGETGDEPVGPPPREAAG